MNVQHGEMGINTIYIIINMNSSHRSFKDLWNYMTPNRLGFLKLITIPRDRSGKILDRIALSKHLPDRRLEFWTMPNYDKDPKGDSEDF